MSVSTLTGGASKDLAQTPNVVPIASYQALRIQRPSLLWIYWNDCYYSQVSAPVMSEFAAKSGMTVQALDGYSSEGRQSLKQAGLKVDGFPTVQYLKGRQNILMDTNLTVRNLYQLVQA